jgi:hypothetical protein
MIERFRDATAGSPGPSMQEAPPQGSIENIFLPRLIARLHREGFEGTLRVTSDPHTRVLYFRRGEIASAASNADSDRLANILIQDGRLTGEQLELAKTRVAPGGSLGKTLIEMGFLTPGELLQGARRQVRDILSACFGLASGSYSVEPGPLPPEATVLGVPTRRLIFDCLAQSNDRGVIVREMGSMESVYGPTDEMIAGLNTLKLEVEKDRVGRSLDGTLSLRDLSGRTSLDDFTVSKVVLALELLGMAQRFGAPPEEEERRPGRSIAVTSGEPQEEPEQVVVPAADEDAIVIEDEPADEAFPQAGTGFPQAGEPAASVDEADAAAMDAAADDPEAIPFAGADEPGAEEQPVPPGGLPAFAVPPEDEPQWQIDPRTGERVHVGPIEMTFDGNIPSRREGSPGFRRIATLAAVITVGLGVLAFFMITRRGGGGAQQPLRAEQETDAPPGADAERGADAEPGRPAAPLEGRAAAVETGEDEAPGQGSPADDIGVTEPEVAPPVAAAPPRAERAEAEPSAGPPPHGSVSPFGKAARYVAALRQFDEGNTDKAARTFQELAAAEAPDRYTLQLMIACEVETLRKARARSGDQGSLFFVPFDLSGRDCYRACWGNYPDVASAQAAAAALPPALTGGGIRPIVVSLGRLGPPS